MSTNTDITDKLLGGVFIDVSTPGPPAEKIRGGSRGRLAVCVCVCVHGRHY
jgi:hypothetical protein